MVENNDQIINLIYRSANKLGLTDQISVLNENACSFESISDKPKFNLVYIDPPYNKNLVVRSIKNILKKNLINKNSVLVIEEERKSKDILIWFDTDTVWLKDPLKDFNDCKVSASWDMDQYCTGFMIFKNTHYAQFIINKWVEVVKTTDRRDQPSFNSLKFKQVCRLSNLSFPSGNLNRSKNEMTVYHNNWIVGHKNKKNRFIQKQLWQPSPICRYVR